MGLPSLEAGMILLIGMSDCHLFRSSSSIQFVQMLTANAMLDLYLVLCLVYPTWHRAIGHSGSHMIWYIDIGIASTQDNYSAAHICTVDLIHVM
jgi:hypothetical protein